MALFDTLRPRITRLKDAEYTFGKRADAELSSSEQKKNNIIHTLESNMTFIINHGKILPDYLTYKWERSFSHILDTLDAGWKEAHDLYVAHNRNMNPILSSVRQSLQKSVDKAGNILAELVLEVDSNVAAYEGRAAHRADHLKEISNEMSNRVVVLDKKLAEIEERSASSFEEIEKQKLEIESDLQMLRSMIAKESYNRVTSNYQALASRYRSWYLAWLVGAGISAIAIIIYAWNLLSYDKIADVATKVVIHQKADESQSMNAQVNAYQDKIESLAQWLKNLVGLGISTLFLRIFMNKFNSERHLNILYSHRASAVNELSILEKAFPEGDTMRYQLRLEAARILLSDPATGYGSKGDGGEVNFNSVVSTLDPFLKSQKPS